MNDFYVYCHKRKDNGVTFYIGKGRGDRYKRKRRALKWKHTNKIAGGFIPVIIKENLTEDEALEYENLLITNQEPSWELINTKLKLEKVLEIPSDVDKYIYYDETSPTCLRWKVNTKAMRRAGDVAGSTNGQYSCVGINSKLYLCHRIVWVLFNGEIPNGLIIDHIDSDRKNNKINNLQMITQSKNCVKAKRCSGISGYRNISFRENGSIRVRYYENGIRKTKHFPTKNKDVESVLFDAINFLNSRGGYEQHNK